MLDLPSLRPHQRAPWHSFCVQLAALALHRARREAIPTDADIWRELLRQLTARDYYRKQYNLQKLEESAA